MRGSSLTHRVTVRSLDTLRLQRELEDPDTPEERREAVRAELQMRQRSLPLGSTDDPSAVR